MFIMDLGLGVFHKPVIRRNIYISNNHRINRWYFKEINFEKLENKSKRKIKHFLLAEFFFHKNEWTNRLLLIPHILVRYRQNTSWQLLGRLLTQWAQNTFVYIVYAVILIFVHQAHSEDFFLLTCFVGYRYQKYLIIPQSA